MSIKMVLGFPQRSHRNLGLYILICMFLSSVAMFLTSYRLYNQSLYNLEQASALQQAAVVRGQRSQLIQKSDFGQFKGQSVGEMENVLNLQLSGKRGHHKKATKDLGIHKHLKTPNTTKTPTSEVEVDPFTSATLLADYHRKTTLSRTWFDCNKLFLGDKSEQDKYSRWVRPQENKSASYDHPQRIFSTIDNFFVPSMVKNCSAFKSIRGYQDTTREIIERDFPVAYVILVHRDFEHLERLVRSLYRPHHTFCIHIDAKASASLKMAVSAFANCFPNIHLAPRPQRIVYAHVSRLMADIGCMLEMLKRGGQWKYLINYAATEFPVRTNLETAHILKALNGLNDIHETFRGRQVRRFEWEHQIVDGTLRPTKRKLPPAPHNITVVKGQAYNTYSRAFLQWVFSDPRPRDFLKWSGRTYSPDEHFWASLNNMYHNPHLDAPGGFYGDPEKKGYLSKFIVWTYERARFPCRGWPVHNICNFNALDLPSIVPQLHLAANKFDLTLDPVAYACMEERLENRTVKPDPDFDRQRYESLFFIRSSKKIDAGL